MLWLAKGHLTPSLGKPPLAKENTSSSTLQLSPSILFNCNTFTNPKTYKYFSFSFLSLFSSLHQKRSLHNSLLHLYLNHQLPKHHLGLHLHLKQLLGLGSSPPSSIVSPWIISDHDLFKLRITDLREYFYSPRLDQFLVYLYLHILCSHVIKIIFLEYQNQPHKNLIFRQTAADFRTSVDRY